MPNKYIFGRAGLWCNEYKWCNVLDKKDTTIIISDNGIGMTEEEVVENIGTIAKSGTAEFLSNMTGDKKKDSNLIIVKANPLCETIQ